MKRYSKSVLSALLTLIYITTQAEPGQEPKVAAVII
jgi:hypothetical protein